MEKNSYYIDGQYPTVGHLLKCNKCGRKIIVENVLIGLDHTLKLLVTCVDCFEINEQFKKEKPEDAIIIENLVEEFKCQ